MPEVTFDPARELTIYFRIARNGSKTFVFLDSVGDPFDVSSEQLEFFIKEFDQSSSKKISLTEGNGLTITVNEVQVDITIAQSSIKEKVYYFELYNGRLGKTWLCGDAPFHNGKFDGVNSDTETISIIENGEQVSITIQESGGSGGVESVSGGAGISVDNTDPSNPVVNIDDAHFGSAAFSDNGDFDPSGAAAAAQAAANANTAATTIGTQDLYIPATAMWPRTTNGCASIAKSEMTTSLLNIQSLDFDQTTQEFAQFTMAMPRNWNNGTVTIRLYWTAASGSGTVQWGLSGGAYSNDDALTVALGSAQTVDDTLIATNDLHITDYTSAITLAGSPQDADFLGFQISRNPASDTLNADAKLLGIVLTLTTDAAIAP